MKRISVLILIGLAVLGCSKDDGEIVESIVGEWNWVKSTGGIADITYTPQTTGENRELVISSDSLKHYTNGELVSKIKYKIEMVHIDDEVLKMIVPEPEEVIRQFFVLEQNRLFLIDDCADCFISEYKRMK